MFQLSNLFNPVKVSITAIVVASFTFFTPSAAMAAIVKLKESYGVNTAFGLNVLIKTDPTTANLLIDTSFKVPDYVALVSNYLSSDVVTTLNVRNLSPTTSPEILNGYSALRFNVAAYDNDDAIDIDYYQKSSLVNIQSNANVVLNASNNQIQQAFSLVSSKQGFEVETFIQPQYSFFNSQVILGRVATQMNISVTHNLEADENSFLYKAADFFDDLSRDGLINTIKNKIRDQVTSEHIIENLRKEIIVEPREGTVIGVRGSIDTVGTSIFTASPGTLVYDLTFSDDAENLFIPFVFGENKDFATLEFFFNDSFLGAVLGKDYEKDVLNFASFDVEQFAGVTGKLSFVLNTTSAQSATVFIPEGFSSVTPVPEPETFAMLFTGLAVLGATVRRKSAA